MTRHIHRRGNDTVKKRPRCKNIAPKACRASNAMTTWKRKWNVDTTLREDRSDHHCVPLPLPMHDYYRTEEDDDDDDDNDVVVVTDRERMRYRGPQHPPKWEESPRTSMHLVDLSSTTTALSSGSTQPPLPVMMRPRKVQFATPDENRIYYVDYSTTASQTWYNRTEYATFKHDLKETILALYRCGGQLWTLDRHQYTLLGLERSLTRPQITGRKQLYQRYVQMIVHEQSRRDPSQLRHISILYSHSSVRRAQIRGIIEPAWPEE